MKVEINRVKQKLVDTIIECRKAMFKTTSGYESEYAASIGKELQATLRNIDKYSNIELHNIMMNVIQYESIVRRIAT